MITQKDLQELVAAVNQVMADLDKRIAALEESAKQASSSNSKKVKEKA